jgi:hypothetical protein
MKRLRIPFGLLLGLLVLGSGAPASAQEILLDRGLRAGPLQCFQAYGNPMTYYYVPDKVRLGTGADGKPQFSFLKYVVNAKSKPGDEPGTEGEGGGIVHCLVELGASPEQVAEARAELRRLVPGATLAGPIIFRAGKFGIISSVKQANGDLAVQVLGIGNAPILEGEKAAVSIRLTKLGAKLLWESFKTSTPDISFTFEMEMRGYRLPYEATLEADFDQIYKHRSWSVGIASTYFGAQIRDTLDDLKSTGAIKVTTKGDDARMDALLMTAYGKICDMMFDKLDNGPFASVASGVPGQGGELDLINRASQYLKDQRDDVRATNREIDAMAAAAAAAAAARSGGSGTTTADNEDPSPRVNEKNYKSGKTVRDEAARNTTGTGMKLPEKRTEPAFALLASYTMKTVRRSGKFSLSFNKYMADSLQLRFDENIGNLSGLMNDRAHFYQVNLDDPVFKQREISVYLDGQNASDFGNFVNYVTVRMRKKHQNGDVTNDEIRIDKETFQKSGNYFKLLYGWKEDSDRNKWMDYEYNEVWSFFGGKEVDRGWKPGSNYSLTVSPPFTRRQLKLEADPNTLQTAGVRMVTVKVYYKDPSGAEQMKQAMLNPASGQLSQTLDYIRQGDKLDYSYELSFRMKDGRTVNTPRKPATDDFILCDEMPGGN